MGRSADESRILCVHADPDAAAAVASSLEGTPGTYAVETLNSVEEARDYLATETLHWLVTGYDFPDGDGVELCETVTASETDLPVIFFVANGSEAIASAAISAGASDYFRYEPDGDKGKSLADRIATMTAGAETDGPSQAGGTGLDTTGEPKFRAVFEGAFDAMIVTDDDRRFVDANPAAVRLFGTGRESLLGRRISEFVPDEYDFEALWEEFQADEQLRGTAPLVRPDGTERIVEFSATREVLPDRHLSILRDRTETHRLREDLDDVFERITDGFLTVDTDWRITYLNDRAATMADGPGSEYVGRSLWDVLPPVEGSDLEEQFRTAMSETEPVTFEAHYPPEDRWYSVRVFPSDTGLSIFISDMTERRNREQAIRKLHEVNRDLLATETRQEVGEVIVGAASSILDLSTAGIYLFDEETGVLRPAATSPDVAEIIGEPPVFSPGESLAWDVFTSGEDAIFSDVSAETGVYNPETPLESEMILSLGDHGVMLAAVIEGEEFDEDTRQLVEILARNAEASLDRALREQKRRESERRLEAKTEELDRAHRVSEFIRDVNQAVARAETREEIEAGICQRLSDQGVTFNWIARPNSTGETLEPVAWNGTESDYLDRLPELLFDGGCLEPTLAAARSRSVVVVDAVSTDLHAEAWRETALEHDLLSVVSIPLVHDDRFFGVLSIYADETGVFEAVSPAIFRELGETIGHAIGTVERTRTVLSERAVELEFASRADDAVAAQLADSVDGSLVVESVVPAAGDSAVAYVTLEDGEVDRLLQIAEESVLVEGVRRIGDPEGSRRFELTLTTRPIEVRLLDRGARPIETVADGTEARLVVQVPESNDVGSVIEFVTDELGEVELQARRQLEETGDILDRAAGAHLTDRQREVMETAYYAGYFDWPRGSTAEDIADSLGVSSATIHHHLREAQRKLVESVTETESPSPR